MSRDENLRRELEWLAAKTRSEETRSGFVPGAFMGPPGAKQKSDAEKCLDNNNRSGRLNWRAAGQATRFGLDALAEGDRHMAGPYLQMAHSAYLQAAAPLLTKADVDHLSTSSAKPPGRPAGPDPKIAERDRRLAEAVAIQEAPPHNLTGDTAITAALRADRELYEVFHDIGMRGLAEAVKRARS